MYVTESKSFWEMLLCTDTPTSRGLAQRRTVGNGGCMKRLKLRKLQAQRVPSSCWFPPPFTAGCCLEPNVAIIWDNSALLLNLEP